MVKTFPAKCADDTFGDWICQGLRGAVGVSSKPNFLICCLKKTSKVPFSVSISLLYHVIIYIWLENIRELEIRELTRDIYSFLTGLSKLD